MCISVSVHSHRSAVTMKLSESHQHELWSIGMRGIATSLAVLLFWGTTAPTIFPELDVYELSRFSGLSITIVLIGCFQSSYTGLLTPNLTVKEKRQGFVLFWFPGSLLLNLVWLPYWSLNIISPLPKTTPDGLFWKILWWSYTLHDKWYEQLTSIVIAIETSRLICNFIGAMGLYKYFRYNSSCVSSQKRQKYEPRRDYHNSLLCFSICGSLQFQSVAIYLFISYYSNGFSNVQNHPYSKTIFWGLNGFLAFASATAAYFASCLLLDDCGSLA